VTIIERSVTRDRERAYTLAVKQSLNYGIITKADNRPSFGTFIDAPTLNVNPIEIVQRGGSEFAYLIVSLN